MPRCPVLRRFHQGLCHTYTVISFLYLVTRSARVDVNAFIATAFCLCAELTGDRLKFVLALM